MNVPVEAIVTEVFDFIFSRIAIPLLILLASIVILSFIFRGFKKTLKLLIIFACIAGLGFGGWLIFKAVTGSLTDAIAFAVAWGPTILFVLIVVIATLVGAKRGLRKSLILLIHSVCAAAVALSVYFVCINLVAVDKGILWIADSVMGGSGALANSLGVSAECTTLREVLYGYILNLVGAQSDVGILISENTAYVSTLVDMVYHIVFGLLALLLYFLLELILYIIYHRFYSERKYRRKKAVAFIENQTGSTYRKRHVGGGVVGLVRGLTAGLLSLSFIGSILFVVAGGVGSGKLKEYDFADDNVNFGYSVYRSIEGYGAQGIFKILNMLTDAEDTPYYLFAADLIFSGELNDEEGNISENVKFREELGAYSGFARETFELLMKYGEEELTPLLSGGATDDAFSTVVGVMSDKRFQIEFNGLIDKFDSQTYVINLAYSLVNSVVNNVDSLSFTDFLSSDNKELLKLIFKKGYLTEVIPEEKKLISKLESNEVTGSKVQPYLNVSGIIDKNDAKLILNVVLDFLENGKDADTLEIIEKILPEINKLSLLSDGRKEEVNPVLGRLYCYTENKYLSSDGYDGISYTQLLNENISWVDELKTLVNATQDVLTIYENVRTQSQPLKMLLCVFDKQDANYAQNIKLFDGVCDAVANSRLLGKTLASSYVFEAISKQLSTVIQDVYIPRDIVYENTYDAQGTLLSRGELHKFLYGLRLLGNSENLIESIFDEKNTDYADVFTQLSETVLSKDKFGCNLSEYLTESVLLRSVISSVLISSSGKGIYVPSSSCEVVNGSTVNLIKQQELKQLFDSMEKIADIVIPVLNGEQIENAGEILQNVTLKTLLKTNGIIAGSAVNALLPVLSKSEFIVVPSALTEVEPWITADGVEGELSKILDALDAAVLDINELLSSDLDTDKLLDKILALDGKVLNALLDSGVLHYSVSEFLSGKNIDFDGFAIIVPLTAKQILKDDAIESVIKKRELTALVEELSALDFSSEITGSELIVKLVQNKEILDNSRIISASLINYITNNSDASAMLDMPQAYVDAGQRDELEFFSSYNPWFTELGSLINALDEIFGISKAGDFDFNEESFADSLSQLLSSLKAQSSVIFGQTKLDVCYSSVIIRNNITKRLDEVFEENEIVDATVLNDAKVNGYYSYGELFALSDALDIYKLDILNLESTELTEKLKAEILNLNKPLEEYGGDSALNVIYPSVIISYLFTCELDKQLDESIINQNLLTRIKAGKKVYSEKEIENLVNTFNELGLSSVDEVDSIDYSDITQFNNASTLFDGETKLQVMYKSQIIGGIMTKSVQESITASSVLCDHPLAYLSDIAIYKESEIECLIQLLGEANLENYEIGNAKDIREFIYNNGKTRSHILTASVSKSIFEHNELLITQNVLDEYGIITPEECALLLDVVDSMSGGTVSDWTVKLTIPDNEVRGVIVKSTIMRATVTEELINRNQSGELLINAGHLAVTSDMQGNKFAIINADQLNALYSSLEICSEEEDGELVIPDFDVPKVSSYSDEELRILFETDIIRYKICGSILANAALRTLLQNEIYYSDVYDLQSGITTSREEVPVEQLIYALNIFRG